jgi:hypothetical protein
MKKNNHIKLAGISAIALLLLVFTGCHKDKTQSTGTLWLHIHTNIDTNEVDAYGNVYPDANGRKMSLSLAQFYVSGVSVLGSNGTWTTVDGAYILKTLDNEEYFVGKVPAGNYTDIKFNVGLDATANATTPSSHSTSTGADSVLAHTDMWYGSTSQGYIFMNVQGTVDIGNTGTPNTAFSYKIGSNALLKTVTMPSQAFTVSPNQVQYVHIICDYSKILDGVDLTVAGNRTIDYTNITSATAVAIANNIPGMFSYEM